MKHKIFEVGKFKTNNNNSMFYTRIEHDQL